MIVLIETNLPKIPPNFAKVLSIILIKPILNLQTSAGGENNQIVLVVPAKSIMEFDHSRELSSLSKVTDLKLIAAILSGRLDSAVIEPPACKYFER